MPLCDISPLLHTCTPASRICPLPLREKRAHRPCPGDEEPVPANGLRRKKLPFGIIRLVSDREDLRLRWKKYFRPELLTVGDAKKLGLPVSARKRGSPPRRRPPPICRPLLTLIIMPHAPPTSSRGTGICPTITTSG